MKRLDSKYMLSDIHVSLQHRGWQRISCFQSRTDLWSKARSRLGRSTQGPKDFHVWPLTGMQGLWVEVTSLVGQGESFLVLPPLCGTKETSHDLFLQVSRGVLMFSPLGSQIRQTTSHSCYLVWGFHES